MPPPNTPSPSRPKCEGVGAEKVKTASSSPRHVGGAWKRDMGKPATKETPHACRPSAGTCLCRRDRNAGRRTVSFTETTAVRFRCLTEDEITAYTPPASRWLVARTAYSSGKWYSSKASAAIGQRGRTALCSLTKTLAEFGVYIKVA